MENIKNIIQSIMLLSMVCAINIFSMRMTPQQAERAKAATEKVMMRMDQQREHNMQREREKQYQPGKYFMYATGTAQGILVDSNKIKQNCKSIALMVQDLGEEPHEISLPYSVDIIKLAFILLDNNSKVSALSYEQLVEVANLFNFLDVPEDKMNNVLDTIKRNVVVASVHDKIFKKLHPDLQKLIMIDPIINCLKTAIIKKYAEDRKKVLVGHAKNVNAVAYSPDGNYIVSGSNDNNLILWNGKTGEQIKILEGHKSAVSCVAYSPDGNYIVSGSRDHNLIVWNGKTGEQIKILEGHKSAVSCVAYSPDGNSIVSGSEDNNLIVWNGKTGEFITILKGHKNWVLCVAYSPDGNYIVSGSIDKDLIVWNGKTGEFITILEGHKRLVSCVAYSPDGNYIVSGSRDHNLIVWNGKTGEQIKILEGHKSAVSCVAYSPDGNYIVSGSDDHNLIVWNGKTGELIKVLEGHNQVVQCVAYSPGGNYIVSGSNDNNLIVWNGKTGEQIKIFKGHDKAMCCVAYSPDGNSIVSGSDDKNLILWSLLSDREVLLLQQFQHYSVDQIRLIYQFCLQSLNNQSIELKQGSEEQKIFMTLPQEMQKLLTGLFLNKGWLDWLVISLINIFVEQKEEM